MSSAHAIVACTDKNFMALACCALFTAQRNTPPGLADFVLVGLDLDNQALEELASFEKQHDVSFKRALVKTENFPGVIAKYRGPALRLELDNILAEDYSRVLYLDSDVLVLGKLSDLIQADLGGRVVAAVQDLMKPWSGNFKRVAQLGLTYKNYFNSGVILFDFKLCKSLEVFKIAREKLITGTCRKGDQDALNFACRNRWLRLPIEWNVTGAFHPRNSISPKIIHFTGGKGSRPWEVGSVPMNRKYQDLYIDLLKGTAYAPFVKRSTIAETLQGIFQLGLSNLRRRSTVHDHLKWHDVEFGRAKAQ